MKLEWIAALLSPRDVAPHPNFMSSERLTPAALFALVAQMRIVDLERILGPDTAQYEVLGPPDELLVVRAARRSIDADSSVAGANQLIELSLLRSIDVACATAATITAAVAFSEADQQQTAVAALETLLSRLSEAEHDPDQQFLRALTHQQLALRRLELGDDGVEDARRAYEYLKSLRPAELSKFDVSKGTGWRSQRTVRLMVEELLVTADEHVANAERNLKGRAWMRFVRSSEPVLRLQTSRAAEEGFMAFLRESFETALSSQERTFYSGDPVETTLYAALLHHELLGAATHARAWRTVLGRLRVLREDRGTESEWMRKEAIRLFRQAEDRKSLDLTLRATRAGGPLAALATDARQVIQQRLDLPRLRRVELSVLGAGAHVLSTAEASLALDAVLAAIRAGVPAASRDWDALGVRLESAWYAATELAPVAGRLDDVALALLEAARDPDDPNQGDDLVERALIRAARNVEWESVGAVPRMAWRSWLVEGPSPLALRLAEVVDPTVVPATAGANEARPVGRAAALINRQLATGEPTPPRDLESLVPAVTAELRSVRDNAAKGHFSFGAVPIGDVAVGLALYGAQDRLWPAIVDFLLDARVSAGDKEAALERMASELGSVPPEELRRFSSEIDRLLASTDPDPFATSITPFPAALRFAAVHSLLSDERLMGELSRLAGSGSDMARAEASRTLALLAQSGSITDWRIVMALQLTHDRDPVVRAEAARTLAQSLRRSDRNRGMIERRLLELLAEDGLLVPLLVLRGLQGDQPEDLPLSLRRRIQDLAVSHQAHGVRLQARALLQIGTST